MSGHMVTIGTLKYVDVDIDLAIEIDIDCLIFFVILAESDNVVYTILTVVKY